jgi:hypothetical protein
VERTIVGFRQDADGDWIVELACDLREQGGGESACFANLVCPDCGAVLDGGPHRLGCPHRGTINSY